MSSGKRNRSLAELEDHTHAPNDRTALQGLLYGDQVNYRSLRKMLKEIGEEKSDRFSKSQVTRTVERYLKSGALSIDDIRKAVENAGGNGGKKERKIAKPEAKKAKTSKTGEMTPAKTAEKKDDVERRNSGVIGFIQNLFSPSKK
ncbi:hypothetical protein NSK_004549 [Nannochloropsis salina CCMP1776]|uniref:Uncharacterized protein n=1 Tax=Nannochloropsis salina CCMP1776 TaxID=1027361 RepID=A0A4D9CYI5_9STRA|nr:hypothetical protein NSK_004549 [Nannochloropsis salina CCMP1776]|eukprot:TFJ84076.1 hypothetical protein NSK_004549 [Nannochloropsis salina CCMP1776]